MSCKRHKWKKTKVYETGAIEYTCEVCGDWMVDFDGRDKETEDIGKERKVE